MFAYFQLAFKMQEILTSDYESNGRFGTALGKIGDINLDGFNDLAISAPFEGNGAVYIHLGGPEGISTKASQRLEAPSVVPSPYDNVQSSMFGFGISRGVDIDANGYRDIAIGSPNSESVYIFKSYPVVDVIATVNSSKTQLSLTDTRFNLNICARMDTRMKIKDNIGETSKCPLDGQSFNSFSF